MKEKARRKLSYAVSIGKVVRKNCEKCNFEKSQAHHDDYSKPLEVRWLCPVHHAEVHKEIDPGKALSEKEVRDYLLTRREEKKTQDKILQERWEKINSLYPEFTMAEIGKVFGTSRQRIQQILERYKKLKKVEQRIQKLKVNIK